MANDTGSFLKSKKMAIIVLTIGIICIVLGLFNSFLLRFMRGPRIRVSPIIWTILLINGIICIVVFIHIWRMNVKIVVPKKEPVQKDELIRNSMVEQKTESLVNELKSIQLNAVQGNTCPNCSADLNLAEKLKVIKYIDCPSCKDSILLENVLEGNKCPNCLNDLADAEIIKLKIITCPKCKKIVKG